MKNAKKSTRKPAAIPKAKKAKLDKALSGDDVLKSIERVAKKNGLEKDVKRLKRSYGDNNGGIRMAVGNILLGRLRRGEPVHGI